MGDSTRRPILKGLASFRTAWLVVLGCASVTGCSTASFYSQALRGHLEIWASREDVDDVISSPRTTQRRRQALIDTAAILEFAGSEMALAARGRYLRVAEIDRRYVVWNVVAAEKFSTEAMARCYPVVGCAAYRGYFSFEGASNEAQRLRSRGYDVHVRGVAAYSTLGWFDDPLLSTFLEWPVERLAELLFHELAHVVVYVAGDTAFNEAYASFVGERGAMRWLEARGDDVEQYRKDRQASVRLNNYLMTWRERMRQLYAVELPVATKLARKNWAMQEIGRCYRQYRALLGAGQFDSYMEEPFNNARLAEISTYRRWLPAFEALFLSGNGDWQTFHADVLALSELSREARFARLLQLSEEEEAKARNDESTEEIECEPFFDHTIHAEATG